MSYYDKHVFFCCNQRDGGRTCCNDKGASAMRDYAKAKVKALGLSPAEERMVLGENFLRLINHRRSACAPPAAFAARGRSRRA